MTSSSGHQETEGACDYTWLTVLKSQATKAASSEDARDPDAKGQGITNETKQAWFPDLLSIRTTISIGHKSQGSIWKYTS